MRLVIDIDDEIYKTWRQEGKYASHSYAQKIILNGTPLTERPKGMWIKIPIMLCHYPCDGCAKDKGHANAEWCSSCEFWKAKDFNYKCSECGKIYSETENYCPNCGTEMEINNDKRIIYPSVWYNALVDATLESLNKLEEVDNK